MSLLELVVRKQLKSFSLETELQLDEGQVLVLFGPSGSGKTITLKTIAGIVEPDSGFISIAGRPVFDSRSGLNVRLQERRVGYLPQNYALFPHMSVAENIAFGLFKWEKSKATRRVAELVELMQLTGLENRSPRQLSGGQQQRVAFARALAPQPDILLLDEPFSALDSSIRAELRQNLALLSRSLQLPVVFITHDLEEAYMLADRIAVYDKGRILQFGSREEVFYQPSTVPVARLVGIRNLWEGRVLEVLSPERRALLRTTLFDIWAEIPVGRALPELENRLTVCLRPERITLLNTIPAQPTPNLLNVRLVGEVARGSLYTLLLGLGNSSQAASADIEVEVTAQNYFELKKTAQEEFKLAVPAEAVHLIY